MKLSKQVEDEIRTGKGEAVIYQLTPEQKEKLIGVCDRIIDILVKETDGPQEAIIALYFVKKGMEEAHGLHMATAFGAEETKH